MFKVTKNGRTQALHSDVQLAAFTANGWEIVTEEGPIRPASGSPDGIDDLAPLKAEADKLGIAYGPNIGATTLRERIDEKKAEQA